MISHSIYQYTFALLLISSPFTFIELAISILSYSKSFFPIANKLPFIDIFMWMEIVAWAVAVARPFGLALPLSEIDVAFEIVNEMVVELVLSEVMNAVGVSFNFEAGTFR